MWGTIAGVVPPVGGVLPVGKMVWSSARRGVSGYMRSTCKVNNDTNKLASLYDMKITHIKS